jgi:hypothetical protein
MRELLETTFLMITGLLAVCGALVIWSAIRFSRLRRKGDLRR